MSYRAADNIASSELISEAETATRCAA